MTNEMNRAARVLADLFIAEATWTRLTAELPPSVLAAARERAAVLVERHHNRSHGRNLLPSHYSDKEE